MPRIFRRKKKTPYRKPNDKQIRRVVNSVIARQSERKCKDGDLATLLANSTTGVVVTKINPPAQGSDGTSRDGDSIYLKNLQVKLLANEGGALSTVLRVILLKWNEDDAVAAPVIGDILSNTTNTDLFTSFYVCNPQKDFKVITDKVMSFDASNSGTKRMLSINHNANTKLNFNAGAITGEGNYYLLTMGQKSVGEFNNVQYRMRYYDN